MWMQFLYFTCLKLTHTYNYRISCTSIYLFCIMRFQLVQVVIQKIVHSIFSTKIIITTKNEKRKSTKFEKKSPFVERDIRRIGFGEMAIRWLGFSVNWPFGELDFRRNGFSVKWPFGEMAIRSTGFVEMAFGEMSGYRWNYIL